MRFRFSLLLAIILYSLVWVHAQKRAFSIEDLYRVKNISELHVSPDGKTVIFVVTNSDLARAKRNSHVWVMDADGKHSRQLTSGEDSEYSISFSPDGQQISFVSSKDANLYLLPTAGGERRKLIDFSTGVTDPLWSPDGKWIAFSSDVYPECGADNGCNQQTAGRWQSGPLQAHLADELLYRHWTTWKDGQRTHIFIANRATGEVRDVTPGKYDAPPFQLGGPLQYDFSPDSSELAYVSNHDPVPAVSTNNDLWIISLNDKEPKPRNITAENPAYDGSPKYSPDGKYIGYRMQKQPGYESDLFRLAIYERATGRSTVLTESFRNWVDEFRWSNDSKTIYFSGPVEGQNPIFRLDLNSKAITKVFTDKTIDASDVDPSERHLFYIKRSVGEPSEIYEAEIADGKASTPRKLSHFNDDLMNEVDIRPAESIWVTGSGGERVQCFIVKPHNFDPAKKYPLILNVHGGPQSNWADAFRGDWQVYPGAGYIVAFPNPHGSTGFGQDYTAEISGDFGGRVFEDLMKVTDSLEKLPYVDPNRMGAMGWSYGGYMMMWFEGHTDRFKAIASMMGMYDLRAFHGATEELWFPQWDLKGKPLDSADYDKWSPANSAKNFKTPALVISGERDYRVPYAQSLNFYTDLQQMKVPSRLIIYSNAGHWPSWYEMALYYTAHVEWFHKYLGGDPPPWTTEQFLRNAVFDRTTGKRIP
ncbi:MAG TPA: S9 family peptidase [Pyrinomonadaceae bacterium]|jgi:dipeptidyl aminopeptidase/acylaminoacyl peptidase|nr:S9 family peptidase [Pyrinomonadaceae bacterium]